MRVSSDSWTEDCAHVHVILQDMIPEGSLECAALHADLHAGLRPSPRIYASDDIHSICAVVKVVDTAEIRSTTVVAISLVHDGVPVYRFHRTSS